MMSAAVLGEHDVVMGIFFSGSTEDVVQVVNKAKEWGYRHLFDRLWRTFAGVTTPRQELGILVMADCGSLEYAKLAKEIGVDALAPTFGFQENSIGIEPDFKLLQEMVDLAMPVIAEGDFWYPEQVIEAASCGIINLM